MTFIRHFSLLLLVALVALFFSCTSVTVVKRKDDLKGKKVRVLLFKGESVRISSTVDLIAKRLKDKEELYRVNEKILVMKKSNVNTDYIISSEKGYLSVNGTHYRGLLKVFKKDNVVMVVNILSLESYLYSVVPSEIMTSWPSEALKAQAVAARTYALHQMQKGNAYYDLTSGTSSQAYNGISKEDSRTTRAVEETEGIYMEYKNQPILALFHSTCGGKTADDTDVWEGGDVPYLTSVKCNYCSNSPHYSWTDTLYLSDVEKYVKKKYKNIANIKKIAFDKRNDRVVMVRVEHDGGILSIPGNTFRLLFPSKTIRSLFFEADGGKNRIVFHGHGWGHGVGMCQWGARGMAEQKKSYREILHFYFKGVSLTRI